MDNYIFNEEVIRQSVLNFMRQLDILPAKTEDEYLILDGHLHRYKTREDKGGDTTGAYCIFLDHWPAGWVQDWRKGDAVTWSFSRDDLDDNGKSFFDDKTFQENLQKSRERQKQLREAREQQFAKAADSARAAFQQLSSEPDPYFTYLQNKKVNPIGVKFNHRYTAYECIVVPLYNINGRIQSLQYIYANGDKKFYPGASAKAAFCPLFLPDNPDVILVGEGYATMATVYQLTGYPSVAAMNCGNLQAVCEALKAKYPQARIIITADNDHRTANNPGLTTANAARDKLNLQAVVAPDFNDNEDGTDWNDFYLQHGEGRAKDVLNKRINWWLMDDKQRIEAQARDKIENLVNELNPAIQLQPQEFIGGMYPRKFVSAIVAPSGTGKTMFMQKNVSDLSIGGSVFDGFVDDEPVRKCLIFAGEAGYELLIRRGAQTKWPINPHNVKVVDQYTFESAEVSVMLDSTEGWENIMRIIDIYKPDVIFFDTFTSFHERDENKATEMKPIIKKLTDLARDFNMAVVLIHHSRKRTAKERALSLNQDDVIGSSVFNRLVALIIGIEPMKEDEKTLLVRPLKTWFSAFMPFTYKITEDIYGHTVVQTDLAPASVNNSKIAVWNYLHDTFEVGEWFSLGDIELGEIIPSVTLRQIKRILADFVKTNKLKKRGSTKGTEYAM